jgi:hypothetical protein
MGQSPRPNGKRERDPYRSRSSLANSTLSGRNRRSWRAPRGFRPGGKCHGISQPFRQDLSGKRLQLLRKSCPGSPAWRSWNPTPPGHRTRDYKKRRQPPAHSIWSFNPSSHQSSQNSDHGLRGPDEDQRAQGVCWCHWQCPSRSRKRFRYCAFAQRNRITSMFGPWNTSAAGGRPHVPLGQAWPSSTVRRHYVGKILQRCRTRRASRTRTDEVRAGHQSQDGKALRLTMPQSVLERADQFIR